MITPVVTRITTDDFWAMHKSVGHDLYEGGSFKTLDGRTIKLPTLTPFSQAKVAILECGLMLNESGGNTGIYILDPGVKDVWSASHRQKVREFVGKEIIRNGKRIKVSYNVDKYGNRKDAVITDNSDAVVYRDGGLLQVCWRSNYYECLQVLRNITSMPIIASKAAELSELVKSRALTESGVRANILNVPMMDYLFSRAHNTIKLAVKLRGKAESFISGLNMTSEADRWKLGKSFGLFHRHLLEAAFQKQAKTGFITATDCDLSLALKTCGLAYNPNCIGSAGQPQYTDTYQGLRSSFSTQTMDSLNVISPTSENLLGSASMLTPQKSAVSVTIGGVNRTVGPATFSSIDIEPNHILDYPGRESLSFEIVL